MSELMQKNQKRNMTVITKYSSVLLIAFSFVLFIPLWVSAEAYRDQPVKMVNLSDFISASAANAMPDEFIESGDDENANFFAGPLSEGNAVAGATNAFDSQQAKRSKMKVLTCHITTSTTDTMKTNFPWVETGVKVAHVAYFEIENRSDFVQFKITLQGPEFSTPLVLETLTFGPQEPMHRWGIGFWRTYSVPGLYKIKMTAYPETNRAGGKSSIECRFRVSEPTE